MPWHIAKSGSCPASKPWAVIKNTDGTVEGCHPTEGDAQKQMAALYASEENTMSTVEHASAVERFYLVSQIERVDVRNSSSNHDDTWTMSGYAAVFNQQATLFDSKFARTTVQIDPHAFDRVMADQPFTKPEGVVHFNRGHDMDTAVAATDVPKGQVGSLVLKVDDYGLQFFARVSRDDPDARALASKMEAGVVKQASFAFNVARDQWTLTENTDGPDEEHRRILEMQQIYDVCACPQGVFSQTISQLQAYAAQLGQPFMGGHQRQPDLGGANPVSPETGGREDITPPTGWSVDLDSILARADHLKPLGGHTEGIRDVPEPQADK